MAVLGAGLSVPGGAAASDRERLLGMIVDQFPAMVAYWDRDCRNVVANSAYVEWFGIAPAEMPGRHIREVLGEAVYQLNLPYIDGVLAGKEQHFERTLVDTLGRTRHTQAAYVPDRAGEEVVGFFVLVTEVTAQVEAERAAQQAVEQYRALAANIPNAFVMVFDGDLRYRVADGPALAAFGLSSDKVEGRLLAEVLPERAAELEPRYRAALAGRQVTWERQLGHRTFALTAGPVRDDTGTVFAGMVIGTDITLVRRQQHRDSILSAIASSSAAGEPVEAVADAVTAGMIDYFESGTAVVVRFDPLRPTIIAIRPTLEVAPDDELVQEMLRHSATAIVEQTHQPAYLHYAEHAATFPLVNQTGIRVGAAVPIMADGRLWGAIGIGLTSTDLDPDATIESLAGFARAAASSITNAAAWQALTQSATIDYLTGLANRRVFDEHLTRELLSAARSTAPVSLVLIDLDYFKAINDTLGHQAGDHVLKTAARRMAGATRKNELLARLGGDEFALIALSDDPQKIANRLRHALNTPDSHYGPIPASIGATATLPGSTNPDDLYRVADAALYHAKRTGRNTTRVQPYPPEKLIQPGSISR